MVDATGLVLVYVRQYFHPVAIVCLDSTVSYTLIILHSYFPGFVDDTRCRIRLVGRQGGQD